MKKFLIIIAILALPVLYMARTDHLRKSPAPETDTAAAADREKSSFPQERDESQVNKTGVINFAASVFTTGSMGSLSMIRGRWLKEEMEQAERMSQQGDSETAYGPKNGRIGNPSACRTMSGELFPRCSWRDATAYCGGLLPTMSQLHRLQRSECFSGSRSPTCDYWFWAADPAGGDNGRYVPFGFSARYGRSKHFAHYSVRCHPRDPDNTSGLTKLSPVNTKFRLKTTFR